MENTRWDDYLVAEHALIERAMAVLEGELKGLVDGSQDIFRLSRAIDFLLTFGDGLHNKKEENALFPLLVKRGIPEQGPIGVMLREHEEERSLLGEIQMKLPEIEMASAEERSEMAANIRAYLKVRAEHIWKENDVLYAMGRKVLTEADGASLMERFERINALTYGDGAAENFAQMVAEIESGAEGVTRPIDKLSPEQLDAIFEAMPIEVTFVDANDQLAYFNHLDGTKIFPRTRSVLGRKVEMCHPPKSLPVVRRIISGFKDGTMDDAEFWIDFKGGKVHINYYAVRNQSGEYLGALETVQDVSHIQALEGQKTLLD